MSLFRIWILDMTNKKSVIFFKVIYTLKHTVDSK